MACGDEIHVGGTPTFVVTVEEDDAAVDISVYSDFKLRFRRPDHTGFEKTASLTTDGTDGKLEYKAVTADLNMPGAWQIQAYLTGGVDVFPSSWGPFRVHPNLPTS